MRAFSPPAGGWARSLLLLIFISISSILLLTPALASASSNEHAHRHRSLAAGRTRGLAVRGPVSAPAKRDASTLMSGGTNNEGEAHGPVDVPKRAKLVSLPVAASSSGSAKKEDAIAAFWTKNNKNSTATHAFIMIHGKLRNGNDYWTIMDSALRSAVKAGYTGASSSAIVVAPQFYSTRFNSGQYSSHELAWADVNAWQAGEVATHPKGTRASAFDVLDALVAEFADASKYPRMRNVTVVGHGGGAQLAQRYAVVGADAPSNVHVRYIYGDPSSAVYFTEQRPVVAASVATKAKCPTYNTWRYGFENYTADVLGAGPNERVAAPDLKQLFGRYARRDVVSLIGLQDTAAGGDQYCMALLQGGPKRRDRNLAYWAYINTLARTRYDLTGFPASFDGPIPDWSAAAPSASGASGEGALAHRLIVIKDADHDPALVFGGAEGRAALFSAGALPTGWRPDGWSAAGAPRPNGSNATTAAGAGAGTGAQGANASASSANTSAAHHSARRPALVALVAAPAAAALLAACA